ncbi:MAG: agmatinase [Candidatus Marsarchaeota archaeon]|jgi:agmatinase|nr:agmatinase [Candidatus Marsarchaeota archaeon]
MRILNATSPINLFGLEGQSYEKANFIAIPVPYDSTMSYGTGSRKGPMAIIEASRHMELYDEELNSNPSDAGVFTTEEIEPDVDSPEKMVRRISKEVGIVMDDGKIPILFGGEHTIALGGIYAASEHYKDVSVLHFDAHSDSRGEFMGSKYSHACIMSRARERCSKCVSVGVRSIDSESARLYKDSIIYMRDVRGGKISDISKRISDMLSKNVYLTVDLDVLDPSEMPSVGTPEPDGMRYNQITSILKLVLHGKRLVGFDISELSPIPGIVAPDYLAAKLAYSIVGYSRKKV